MSAEGKFARENPELPSHQWTSNDLVEAYKAYLTELPKTRAEIQRYFDPGKVANQRRKAERSERISAAWALLQTCHDHGANYSAAYWAKTWHLRWKKGNSLAPEALAQCSSRMLAEYIREARKIYGATCSQKF